MKNTHRIKALRELLIGNTDKAMDLLKGNRKRKVKVNVSYTNIDNEGFIIKDNKRFTEDEFKIYCRQNNIIYVTAK